MTMVQVQYKGVIVSGAERSKPVPVVISELHAKIGTQPENCRIFPSSGRYPTNSQFFQSSSYQYTSIYRDISAPDFSVINSIPFKSLANLAVAFRFAYNCRLRVLSEHNSSTIKIM